MKRYDEVEACVDDALARVGRKVVLGIPLGLGKPNQLVNAFYRRAAADPALELTIVTALTLSPPRWRSELERRLVQPVGERLFAGYPELEYARARETGRLPRNIDVREFYFAPATQLDNPRAQQSHMCSNYTHVVRDVIDLGINVFAQLVSAPGAEGTPEAGKLSLSCNPDLTLDLVPRMRAEEARGRPVTVLAQVNPELPFMGGDAAVAPECFDGVVDNSALYFPLCGPPNSAVGTAEYMIALHASALIRDGGTIQLGIGAISDAITHLLVMRHEQNDAYRQLLTDTGVLESCGSTLEKLGGTGPFTTGLYAASEMFVDGFLDLWQHGVLRREAEDGAVAHAAFFLGPRAFYERMRKLDPADRARFHMKSVSFVNQLYPDTELKLRQRRDARFLNTALKVTLSGAAASDGLADGRVLSGVGGQPDFVTMAHALPDGRSILMLRSQRDAAGRAESNVVPRYAHCTIPRQMRDIVVTEYGIAELRGLCDAEVAGAVIDVADSRFQPELLRRAKAAGKLPASHRVHQRFRANIPQRLQRQLAPHRKAGRLPEFPQGTELTEVEVVLGRALRALAARRLPPSPFALGRVITPPAAAKPYLERMGLDYPQSLRERALRRALLYGLTLVGAI